jgi:hypothetical protein
MRMQRTRHEKTEDMICGGLGQDVRRLRTRCGEAEEKMRGG